MPGIPSTSGRLHSKFVRLLFLQTHQETDRFFASSRVQIPQSDRGYFHFRRSTFLANLKSRVVLTLTKATALRITLNFRRDTYYFNNTYSPITLANISPINLVFFFRCSSSPSNTVHVRCIDFSGLVFSLSSHRHSYRTYL